MVAYIKRSALKVSREENMVKKGLMRRRGRLQMEPWFITVFSALTHCPCAEWIWVRLLRGQGAISHQSCNSITMPGGGVPRFGKGGNGDFRKIEFWQSTDCVNERDGTPRAVLSRQPQDSLWGDSSSGSSVGVCVKLSSCVLVVNGSHCLSGDSC